MSNEDLIHRARQQATSLRRDHPAELLCAPSVRPAATTLDDLCDALQTAERERDELRASHDRIHLELSNRAEAQGKAETRLRQIEEAAKPAVTELLWADERINGEHDICGMCEAGVALRALIPEEKPE